VHFDLRAILVCLKIILDRVRENTHWLRRLWLRNLWFSRGCMVEVVGSDESKQRNERSVLFASDEQLLPVVQTGSSSHRVVLKPHKK
jgi:hypothetical protein